MIAFFHYGANNDISGVTSWLQGLLLSLQQCEQDVSLRIHHFGNNPADGSLYQVARANEMLVSAVTMPMSSRRAVRDIMLYLNHAKPSIFIPQCLPAAHFTAALAQKEGIPWIFTIHSDDPAYWALADLTGPSRQHGAWVAVSQSIASDARQHYPHADVRVIPCGVDIPDRNAVWCPGRFRIVYSGRLIEEQKRIYLVLEVLVAACRLSPLIEAVFIGDGAERSGLEEKVRLEGMEGRIRFTGRLDSEGVQRELLDAQALVLMSDYEGLPVALLEAMACGVVPVVRNIRSGIPEVVHDRVTGLLVDEDPLTAAKVIVLLASDELFWTKMSAAGRKIVSENYSQQNSLQKWHSLIQEIKERSTVNYPLHIPMFPRLPKYDMRLRKLDQRTPELLQRIQHKIVKILKYFCLML